MVRSSLLLILFTAVLSAATSFKEQVGSVAVGPVVGSGAVRTPFILWGGDIITFRANGDSLQTKPGSPFAERNLAIDLVPGDDFVQQVRDYMSGKSPFLRGTYRMIGQASEVINADPRTRGVVVMQLTWSAGDHLVGTGTISQLKGKRVALQYGGPHVGMLDDILRTANLSWSDIQVVWCKDLTASEDSPASKLRNGLADVAFVITPDMIGLCGGLRGVGSGAEGTHKGAKVVMSTAEMSRSIADVYVVRKDFFDANKPLVKNFVNGYLKAAEQVVALRNDFESGKKDPSYINLLKTTQSIYGKDVIVSLEDDAHGLLLDCTPVGLPGNSVFFSVSAGDPTGFKAFNTRSVALAEQLGITAGGQDFLAPDWSWSDPALVKDLKHTEVKRGERFQAEAVLSELEALSGDAALDDRTLLAFDIGFAPNQIDFNSRDYEREYVRVIELSRTYGNAVVAIRGHSDPSLTLINMIKAGFKKGVLKRMGTKGNYKYFLNGAPFDIKDSQALIKAVEANTFAGVPEHDPLQTMTAARNLSRKRAEVVRNSIIAFAKSRGVAIDASQIQPIGVGISEPMVAAPRSPDQAAANRRVEFRLVRVEAEAALSESDFDF